MDKNLNASIMRIYDSMTDEQKAKANACKTMADLISLAGKEGIELTDEVLDAVAGGVPLLDCQEHVAGKCDDDC